MSTELLRPPPAYGGSSRPNSSYVELPEYAENLLFAYYNDSSKAPPNYNHDDEESSIGSQANETVPSLPLPPHIVEANQNHNTGQQQHNDLADHESIRQRNRLHYLHPSTASAFVQDLTKKRQVAAKGIRSFLWKLLAFVILFLFYAVYAGFFLGVPALMIYGWAGGNFGNKKDDGDKDV